MIPYIFLGFLVNGRGHLLVKLLDAIRQGFDLRLINAGIVCSQADFKGWSPSKKAK